MTVVARPRPDLLFNVLGVLLIVAGIAITVVGLGYAVQVMSDSTRFGVTGRRSRSRTAWPWRSGESSC